jgi:hypothetical protein
MTFINTLSQIFMIHSFFFQFIEFIVYPRKFLKDNGKDRKEKFFYFETLQSHADHTPDITTRVRAVTSFTFFGSIKVDLIFFFFDKKYKLINLFLEKKRIDNPTSYTNKGVRSFHLF